MLRWIAAPIGRIGMPADTACAASTVAARSFALPGPATSILAAAAGSAAIARASGHVGALELASAAAVLVAAWFVARLWPTRGLDFVACAICALAALGAVIALGQPEQRGTHRWLRLQTGDLSVALVLSATAPLVLAAGASSSWRRIAATIAIGLLIASKSYSLALLCAAACVAAFEWQSRKRAIAVVAVAAVVIVGASLANPNRAARVAGFYSAAAPVPFQVGRAREALREIEWTGAARAVTSVPCATSDFALLDLGRKHGIAAIVHWIGAQIVVLAALLAHGAAVPSAAAMARAVSTYAFVGALGYLGVNLTLLPPAGFVAAFTGASGASWVVATFCVARALATPPSERRSALPSRRSSTIAASLVLLLAPLAIVAASAASGSPRRAANSSRTSPAAAIATEPSRIVIERRLGGVAVQIDLEPDHHVASLTRDLSAALASLDVLGRVGVLAIACRCERCATANPRESPVEGASVDSPQGSIVVRVRLTDQASVASPTVAPPPTVADGPPTTVNIQLPINRPPQFLAQDVLRSIATLLVEREERLGGIRE